MRHTIPAKDNQIPVVEALKLYNIDVGVAFNALRDIEDSIVIRCPFPDHLDRTPSFHLYGDGHFRCYGRCGRWGDSYELVKHMEPGLSHDEIVATVAVGRRIPHLSVDAGYTMDTELFRTISRTIRIAAPLDADDRYYTLDMAMLMKPPRTDLGLRALEGIAEAKGTDMEQVNLYDHKWCAGDVADTEVEIEGSMHQYQFTITKDFDPEDPTSALCVVANAVGKDASFVQEWTGLHAKELANTAPWLVTPAVTEPTVPEAEDFNPFATTDQAAVDLSDKESAERVAAVEAEATTTEEPVTTSEETSGNVNMTDPDDVAALMSGPLVDEPIGEPLDMSEPVDAPQVEDPDPESTEESTEAPVEVAQEPDPFEDQTPPDPDVPAATVEDLLDPTSGRPSHWKFGDEAAEKALERIYEFVAASRRRYRASEIVERIGGELEEGKLCMPDEVADLVTQSDDLVVKGAGWIHTFASHDANERANAVNPGRVRAAKLQYGSVMSKKELVASLQSLLCYVLGQALEAGADKIKEECAKLMAQDGAVETLGPSDE